MELCSKCIGKIQLHRKKMMFSFTAFLLLFVLFINNSQTQTLKIQPSLAKSITDSEILDLVRKINIIESQIIPIDTEIRSLEENHDKIINEITTLKEQIRKPKGVLDRITGVFGFSERKLKKLMADSQYMSDRIAELQRMRIPLIKELDIQTARLINKAEIRINALMDIIIKKETGLDKAGEQISALLQLTRKASDLRDEYIAESITQVKAFPFSSSLADDPEKLRLGAKLSKNMAQGLKVEAEKKKRELKDLQSRKLLNERTLEKLREIQLSNDERESSGAESGTVGLTISSNESEIRRKINELKKDIDRLSIEIRDLEEDAKSLENQSRIFEQRASQIESMPKTK
ncbi:MAG: hypothetical protein ACPL7B_06440 [Candidatus Poribacteria bacterium]